MDKQTLLKKIWDMAFSPSCYPDLREATKNYFSVLGTPNEKIAAQNFLDELKKDVEPIDTLLIFAHSNRAIEMFGAERAKIFAANADALKASGAKWCNCRACTLGLEIPEHKDILLN